MLLKTQEQYQLKTQRSTLRGARANLGWWRLERRGGTCSPGPPAPALLSHTVLVNIIIIITFTTITMIIISFTTIIIIIITFTTVTMIIIRWQLLLLLLLPSSPALLSHTVVAIINIITNNTIIISRLSILINVGFIAVLRC